MSFDMAFKIAVKCFTYNQASFIKEAMDGFCMQETDFPFICIIVDDASTDGEPDVIRQYLSEHFDLEGDVTRNEETEDYLQTFARHKTNLNCFFVVLFLKYNHYKKKAKAPYFQQWTDNVPYSAFCEGDDYWTDSSKLQKQVDFLDKHEDYVVCSHDFIQFFEKEKRFADRSYYAYLKNDNGEREYLDFSLDNYFERWWTQPLACVRRNGSYLKLIPSQKYKNYRDDIFYYYVLKEGKGALLYDTMGVYRVHDAGVWSSNDSIQKNKLGFDNARDIYRVEGDVRAITRMERELFRIVTVLFNSHCYRQSFKEVLYYWKIVPHKYFYAFVAKLRVWFFNKIRRHLGLRER